MLSICETLNDDETVDDDNMNHAATIKHLETVWHQVWLRALEWECLLEESLARGTEEVSLGLVFTLFNICITGGQWCA